MGVISREDAADEERWIRYGSAPLIATLVLPIIIGVILLLKCVFNHCCVRRTTTKDEMYGLEGRMTMLSTADSNFVTLPNNNICPSLQPQPVSPSLTSNDVSSAALFNYSEAPNASESSSKPLPNVLANDISENSSIYEDGIGIRITNAEKAEYRRSSSSRLTSSQDSSDLAGSLKRASAQHRQLPDLPQIPTHLAVTQSIPRRSSSVLSHDGTSELYATVGETPIPDGSDRPSKRSSHYAQIRDNGSEKNNLPSTSTGSQSSSFMNGATGNSTSSATRPAGLKIGRAGIEATPSSDSETYASSHHPYAKLKKNTEHPYARVRSSGTGANGNDEETDTDNYDLPQFLSRQAVPSTSNAPPSSSTSRPSGANSNSNNGNGAGNSVEAEGPVPPRRVGRQWRRGSQPQTLSNDNASHFSGDSQDSRGYTSISVREPLSNIRSQVANTRSYDSHYATVSDDSEEMYAAIDDPNDSNYMKIPGDDPRRPWMGGPNVASPIPERREANSPLPPVPPVPNVPPPELSPGPSSSAPVPLPPASPTSQAGNSISASLPVYAQVTKKSKKSKTPVTPTASNASTSSQQMREVVSTTSQSNEIVSHPVTNGPHTLSASSTVKETLSHHHPPHRSKRAASLMDNSNPMDADTSDVRRWSKADISYSEFEVVRESIFPGEEHLSPSAAVVRESPVESPNRQGTQQLGLAVDLVDEDNYNIIPEKSARRGAGAVVESTSSKSRQRLDSGNYHEIDPPLHNTYQEIGSGKEPSDHYQEIGDRRNLDDGADLYQEIERKSTTFDEEEEEEDQFYERVKPSSHKSKKSNQSEKKHGYEKIKRKGGLSRPGNLSAVIPAIGSDEEEDDDDDDKADQLYESVKYPPYERLKESKDDLLDSHDEDGRNGSDFYEDIGYSRVKPNSKKEKSIKPEIVEDDLQEGNSARSDVDVSQLYARVDKSKKRKGSTSSSIPVGHQDNRHISSTQQEISCNNNEPSGIKCDIDYSSGQQLYSKVTKSTKSNRNADTRSSVSVNSVGAGVGRGHVESEPRLDNDNSIEYI